MSKKVAKDHHLSLLLGEFAAGTITRDGEEWEPFSPCARHDWCWFGDFVSSPETLIDLILPICDCGDDYY